MASKDYVTMKETETRQWYALGIFSVLACIGIALAIYNFSSRISVLEEKTNNLQKTMELYEQKNKELKKENEKYIKSVIAMTSDGCSVVLTGGNNEQ